ncbi:hypothetical protein [Legionella sp.]|uniref:hypothetical protein n=1 Tax=Legionella sp. TaxID=459 RepID=UPI003220434B
MSSNARMSHSYTELKQHIVFWITRNQQSTDPLIQLKMIGLNLVLASAEKVHKNLMRYMKDREHDLIRILLLINQIIDCSTDEQRLGALIAKAQELTLRLEKQESSRRTKDFLYVLLGMVVFIGVIIAITLCATSPVAWMIPVIIILAISLFPLMMEMAASDHQVKLNKRLGFFCRSYSASQDNYDSLMQESKELAQEEQSTGSVSSHREESGGEAIIRMARAHQDNNLFGMQIYPVF